LKPNRGEWQGAHPKLRAKHPREQGLKPETFKNMQRRCALRAKHPREQGLKPRISSGDFCLAYFTSSETSTRTRIETKPSQTVGMITDLRAKHPREQGLKPKFFGTCCLGYILRAKHPREQGLKHYYMPTHRPQNTLRAKHPREQGLKPKYVLVGVGLPAEASSETSTRTRIETGIVRV